MHKFRCVGCGYTLEAEAPPEECPFCHEKCDFVDDACYTPDCGGPEKDSK